MSLRATDCELLVHGKNWRGRLVQWVEKASLEKIRRLLEVFEQERHYEVLLTLKNLADVRLSPAPYSLPIILRSLPLEIVDGEHFITSDLLSLFAANAHQLGTQKLKHRTGNKRHGPRLYRRPLPARIPAQPHQDPVGTKGVSSRRGFLYQERGSVFPPEYRKSERRGHAE